MKFSFLFIVLLVSCATRTPVTDKLTRKSHIPLSSQIREVPAIKQEEKQCGPAALAMVLQYHGVNKTPESLSNELFQKDLGGSFRSDILTSARREGMMVMEIHDLSQALEEISAGNPVLVFQNVGFEMAPQYHFSVLTGYDLKGPDVVLNAGKAKEESWDMRVFERSWVLGGKWGAVILPPEKLSQSLSELAHVEAASLLEASGKNEEARKAYEAILSKWPQSHLGLIGAANVAYGKNNLKQASSFLTRATQADPKSAVAWHNLALVQNELGDIKAAKFSAKKAQELVEKENEEQFKVSLKKLL